MNKKGRGQHFYNERKVERSTFLERKVDMSTMKEKSAMNEKGRDVNTSEIK